MKTGFFAIVVGLALSVAACAQDMPPDSQAPAQGDWQGQHRGRGPGMGPGRMGRGLEGTVTEVAADHYTIKTDAGDTYTVNFNSDTRILKQSMPRPASGEQSQPGSRPRPEQLKPSDIKIGDVVNAMGEVNSSAKAVAAKAILLIDPERAKMMEEMRANFGKTWLQGKVTAISGTSITLAGSVDNASHTFVADENTSLRKHRDPITLADIQVGDVVRVDGALKDGAFTATRVNVMGMPPAPSTVPRQPEPQPQQ